MRHSHVALVLALTAGSCSVESPLEPFRHATLIPGTSLGPARLGVTTLGPFRETYGPGHLSLLASDDFCAIEVSYEYMQFSFLFELDAHTAYSYDSPNIVRGLHDLDGFIELHPEVADAVLHSLSVNGKMSRDDTFYRGGIGPRAELHADLAAFEGFAEDGFVVDAPTFVAGAAEDLPPLRFTSWQSGFTVYLTEPEEGGAPFVKRITIFQPGLQP